MEALKVLQGVAEVKGGLKPVFEFCDGYLRVTTYAGEEAIVRYVGINGIMDHILTSITVKDGAIVMTDIDRDLNETETVFPLAAGYKKGVKGWCEEVRKAMRTVSILSLDRKVIARRMRNGAVK